MLAQLSIVFLLYTLIRFVLPLPISLLAKAGLGSLITVIALKFEFYKRLGGSFFMPDLPYWFVLPITFLYSVLVVLVLLLLIRDVVLVLFWIAKALKLVSFIPLTSISSTIGIAVLSLILAAFGTWQALRVPDVVARDVTVPNLPSELAGLKIVQLSDLHISALFKKDWLEAVVAKTNALKPDLILITGDMLDGSPQQLAPHLEPLQDLRARYGVFGVAGNHEYYSGFDRWMPFFEKWGITMLHNRHVTLTINGTQIVLAGITDPVATSFGKPSPNPQQALANAPEKALRLLMAHQPRQAAEHAALNIQIQFSGHTHGGLITLLDTWLIAAYNDGFVSGWYPVGTMQLYVHPGTGLWNGFPLRIGVPSEIACIKLERD